MSRGGQGARILAGALAMAVGGSSGFGLAAPRIVSADAAAITAGPSTGLADGQFVKLSFSGFAPGIGLTFRQCASPTRSLGLDCTPVNQAVFATIDASGGGSTYIPVYAGNDPDAENAAGTGPIPCDVAHSCVIAGLRSGDDLSTAVFAPVSFGPSPDACPAPGPGSILGAGSASAYRAVFAWESAACQAPTSISAGYTFSSSPDGIANFQKGLADFGVTGPGPVPAPPPGSPTFKYAPLTTSAVGVAYRIYDRRGPQITSLTLTPDLLAKVFLGQISNWNVNSDIVALNPGVEFPPRMVPFARAERSAQSFVFSSWLARAAPSVWTAGAQSIFPQGSGQVIGVTGSAGMGRAVVDPTTDFFGQGNVGFMDTSTAAFYGLPTVQIKRADGSTIAATQASISRAIADATSNPDGTITTDYGNGDPLAYPMPMPTYMLAPTNTISADHGATLAAFLRYAVQGGQSTLPPGYAPLPAALVAESLQVAGLIPTTQPQPLAAAPATVATPGTNAAPPVTLTPSGTLPTALAPAGSASMSLPITPLNAPLAAPAACGAGARCPAAPHPGARRGPPLSTASHGVDAALLAQFGAATPARYVLPVIAALAVAGLVCGLAVQALSRRRRVGVDGGTHATYGLSAGLVAEGRE